MSENSQKKETTGWFVVRWILPFFGVMLIANIVFVWFALSTHTGIQVENAYDKGANYNQILEQARERELLGWQVDLDIEEHLILIALFDKAGNPIENAEIDVFLFSPRSANNDQVLMVQKLDGGQFSAPYPSELDGQWELRLTVKNEGKSVEYRRKLVLP